MSHVIAFGEVGKWHFPKDDCEFVRKLTRTYPDALPYGRYWHPKSI